jgi:1,5-anhydro-D-fructose reductase (1,5-anhydro-D-mannitol-forming)
MTLIRWGMIGCGNVTERKSAPAYQQVEGFALHGLFNRTRA